MRIVVSLTLVFVLMMSFTSLVLANFTGQPIKIAVASDEQIKEQLKEQLSSKLEEKKDEIITEKQRFSREKEELRNGTGYRIIISPINDSGRIVKLKIEDTLKGNTIERKIKYIASSGVEEEINSSLRIFDYVGEGNLSRIRAQLSDGSEKDIKILPVAASEKAREIFNSRDITMILTQKSHNHIPTAVYHAESKKEGRFLGLFKMSVNVNADIDVDSGEIINKGKPWWSFLVTGEDD